MRREVRERKNVPRKGFTIVELLIVIVVIAILAAITIISYNGIRNRADASALQSELASVAKKVEAAKAQGGLEQFPLTLTDAGVSSSVVLYSTNLSSNRTEYCAVAAKGALSYYITSRTNTVAPGNCTVSSGLVGQWNFNGNTNDSTGYGNGANNNATLTTGQNGATNAAYSFDGSTSYITANTPSINVNSFSTTVWFKMTSAGDRKIVSADGSTSTHIIQVMPGGVLRTCIIGSCVVGAKNVADGQWHFVAIQGSSSGVTSYLDGASTPEFSLAYSSVGAIGTQIRIGADFPPVRFYNGQIDDVRMYNRPLSIDEMQIIYSAGAQ